MSDRSKLLLDVSTWAARKRDGRIVTPDLVMSRRDCEIWRQGYYAAMNAAAQHFNMERLAAERETP